MGWKAAEKLNSGGGTNDAKSNTLIGRSVLQNSATAYYNTAVGYGAMQFVKTDGDNDPHSNVAIGYFAMRGASTNGAWGGAANKNNYGHENVAIGFEAMKVAQNADENVVIGFKAGDAMTTGNWNTVVGKGAGGIQTTANYNTFIGYNAGDGIKSQGNNVMIGAGADGDSQTSQYRIGIGRSVTVSENNTAVIGNTDLTKLYVAQDGEGVLYANATINTSDMRLKDFIKPVNLGLQFINKLNPVSYMKISKSQYKGEEDNDYRYEFGLLAQEVDEILKDSNPESTIVTKDQEGFLGMDYKQIIMPLIKSVQELSAEIDRLKAEIEELKK